MQRTGVKALPQALLNGIPLPTSQITVDDFEEAVLQEVMLQTPTFQKAIYRGRLQDKDDIFEYIMTRPNVMPRLNERILSKDSSVNLDMSGRAVSTMNVQNLIKLSPRDMTATALENLKYFTTSRKTEKYYSITYWIIGDLNEKQTRDLLLAALEHLVRSVINLKIIKINLYVFVFRKIVVTLELAFFQMSTETKIIRSISSFL